MFTYTVNKQRKIYSTVEFPITLIFYTVYNNKKIFNLSSH